MKAILTTQDPIKALRHGTATELNNTVDTANSSCQH